MLYETKSYSTEKEILRNDHFVTRAITLDFTDVTTTENGIKVVKAGTPIGSDGVASASAPVGVLWKNAYEIDPNAAIIIHGFLDYAKAKAASGMDSTYPTAATIETKIPMIKCL